MVNKKIKLEVGASEFVPKKEYLPCMTHYWVRGKIRGQPVYLAVRSRGSLLDDMSSLAKLAINEYVCNNVDNNVESYSFTIKNYAKDNQVYSDSDLWTTTSRALTASELEQLLATFDVRESELQ